MKIAVLGLMLVLSISCGELTRQGTAASYLRIDELTAASGAEPQEFGNDLASDVITVVNDVPTVFADLGRVELSVALKDPGTAEAPLEPGRNNFITVNRYRVRYIRSDGRNTPGVDVPYPFDGAVTGTAGFNAAALSFTLVRVQAKSEAPLAGLVNNFTTISTIAEITFYGRDQTGREVSVTGNIGVSFSNWGDPQ